MAVDTKRFSSQTPTYQLASKTPDVLQEFIHAIGLEPPWQLGRCPVPANHVQLVTLRLQMNRPQGPARKRNLVHPAPTFIASPNITGEVTRAASKATAPSCSRRLRLPLCPLLANSQVEPYLVHQVCGKKGLVWVALSKQAASRGEHGAFEGPLVTPNSSLLSIPVPSLSQARGVC